MTLTALTAGVVGIWTLVIFMVPWVRFVIFAPRAKTGFDVSVALLSLFVALVLLLFPVAQERTRLTWVAMGFLTLSLGALVFGYLLPVLGWSNDLGRAMYCSLAVRTAALLAIGVGLILTAPPHLSMRTAWWLAASIAATVGTIALLSPLLPPLARVRDLQPVAEQSTRVLHGLTGWHWGLSLIPLVLAIMAVGGVICHADALRQHGWLAAGMTLMAGSQLHTMFWPSAYSPILTTASIMRLGFTLAVTIGAVLALRQIALERSALLAAEQALTAQRAALAKQQSDFLSMIGHELAAPVASLRAYAASLATGALDCGQQAQVGSALAAEAQLLAKLVTDLRAAAQAEQLDFTLTRTPVRLGVLLSEAAAFARALPGDRPVEVLTACDDWVLADPQRLAQVLRNLLGNAGKYTSPGTRITLQTMRAAAEIRIEVADHGRGIPPKDRERIFDRFTRGEPPPGTEAPTGLGLGLYLSQQIIRAHGGVLSVDETPGGGATFWFTLPLVDPPPTPGDRHQAALASTG